MRGTALLWLVASATVRADGSSDAAWRAGLDAYRAKDYAKACPLLQKAADAASTNGDAWADLGLCEHRRGNTQASIHASYLAVRYGAEETRKAAYFNLSLAGADIAPEPAANACSEIEVPKELGCAKRVAACSYVYQDLQSNYLDKRSSGLLFERCDGTCPEQSRYGWKCGSDGASDCWEPDITLVNESTGRGHSSYPPWSCQESPAVAARALACIAKKGANKKACEKKACAEAKRLQKDDAALKSRWTELQYELDRWDASHSCQSCSWSTNKTTCGVVSIDPCLNRAGVVCTTKVSSGDDLSGYSETSSTSEAQEIELTFAPSTQYAPP